MTILQIDHTPFDPVALLGKGWSISEQDQHSSSLVEIDIAKIVLKTMLKGDECYIPGFEASRRAKEINCIHLDARVFDFFWKKQHLIPSEYKKWRSVPPNLVLPGGSGMNSASIIFGGTRLIGPRGNSECLLSLFWDGEVWGWGLCHFNCGRWNADAYFAFFEN